jgi:hypothetical protein
VVPQKFNVIAPQFNLDPKLVNSVYPPPGHTDEGRVPSHIVFNDPHVPWDRINRTDVRASLREDMNLDIPFPPWIALVVFDADELVPSPADVTALGIPNPPAATTAGAPQVGTSSSQVSSPGAYSMSVNDYLTKITSRIKYEALYTGAAWADLLASTDQTSIIFPKKALAQTIFQPTAKYSL